MITKSPGSGRPPLARAAAPSRKAAARRRPQRQPEAQLQKRTEYRTDNASVVLDHDGRAWILRSDGWDRTARLPVKTVDALAEVALG